MLNKLKEIKNNWIKNYFIRLFFLLWIFSLNFFNSVYSSSQVLFGKADYTKILNFRGNYIRFSKPDNLLIGGKKILSNPTPVMLNNQKIYSDFADVTTRPRFINNSDFRKFIFNYIKPSLTSLPNGTYILSFLNFVVDKKGKLVYFDFKKIRSVSHNIKSQAIEMTSDSNSESILHYVQSLVNREIKNSNSKKTISQDTSITFKAIENRIYSELYKILISAEIKFTPASKNNNNVNCSVNVYPIKFDVKEHKVVYDETFFGDYANKK